MLINERGDGVEAVLDGAEILGLSGRATEVLRWGIDADIGDRWGTPGPGHTLSASFPSRAVALDFAARFLPDAFLKAAEDALAPYGAYQEAIVSDGQVLASIRYVGDAGQGTDDEPHDTTWSDYVRFAEAAREAGFEVEMNNSDHDTVDVTMRPAARRPAAA